MHARRLRTFAVAVLAAAAATVGVTVPASAEGGGPPVGDDGSNLTGRVAEQVDTINDGRPGGGASKPPSCDWVERDTDSPAPPGPPGPPGELGPNDKERHDGTVRWTEPERGHGYWEDQEDLFEGKGTIFRYECWHPDMEKECKFQADDGRCMGMPIDETWCGMFLCEFDAINPQNLARLAIDEFIQSIGPPTPHFNPPNGRTYVNFPTWMWVDNVNGGHIDAPTISVPGLTVHTYADLDKVTWTMGDGGTKDCPLTVTEASAQTDCTYQYTRSSANQPNNTYTGQASTVWEATWSIEENGQTGTIDAPRSTDFTLEVAEVQTVVR